MVYKDSYAVAYRSGGTHHCFWRRVLDIFDEKGASDRKVEIERAGYKALVYKAVSLDAIGLPIGWEPGLVNFERDTVRVSPIETFVSREFAAHV